MGMVGGAGVGVAGGVEVGSIVGVKVEGGSVVVGMAVWVRATAVHAKGATMLASVASGVACPQAVSRARRTIQK